MDANELYDPEFRELIKSKNPTVIIPIGSLEQHGAHLPITTDSDIVTEIASRLAKKCGFIVFPTVSYGWSYEHRPLFNVTIRTIPILRDIVMSLVLNKIKSVIILNGHHGNVKHLEAMKDGYQQPNPEPRIKFPNDFKINFYSYWHFMKREFDHAGFVETSLMLAISDKVRMKKAKKGLITKDLSKKEIQRIKKLSTEIGGFPKVAKNGVWGDPTKATKKDGEKFLAEIVRNLAKECQT
jgi:creatinine amidohydrolase